MKKNIFKKGMAGALAFVMCLTTAISAVGVTVKAEEAPATYTVAALEDEHGSILLNDSTESLQAEAGDVVTVKVTADEGYQTEKVIALDSNNQETELTDKGGYYEATVGESDLTIAATITKVETADATTSDSKEEGSTSKTNEKTKINFNIGKGGSVTIVGADNKEIELESGKHSYEFPTETYVRVKMTSDKKTTIKVYDTENMVETEDATSVSDKDFFRDISLGGRETTVKVTFGSSKLRRAAASVSTCNLGNEDRPEVNDVFNGECIVASVSQRRPGGAVDGVVVNISTGILAGKSVNAVCADHTAAAPFVGQRYTYVATVTSVNKTTGQVVLSAYMTCIPASASSDGVTMLNGALAGYQRLRGSLTITRQYEGYLQIVKSSTNPELTNNNPCYSLSSAVYGVYSDSGCTREVGRLTTGSDGKTGTIKLSMGTYYIKEITAPKGFDLSSDKTPFNVVAGTTTPVYVSDVPLDDPVTMMLHKLDIETGEADPQGDGTLGGAEFKVSYYSGYYDSKEELPEKATRYWVMKTRDDGVTSIILGNDYKVAGDDLYYINGVISIPLGTITIEETKAPEGYLLPEDGLFTMQKITEDPETHTVTGFNKAGKDMNEQVIRGGVQIIKSDLELDESEALGGKDHGTDPEGTRLSGIEFTIKNESTNDVFVDGTNYQPGDVITTIKTHWNKEKKAYTAEVADDYLPYGTYSIQETKTNESYLLTDGKARTFEIREDGKIVTVDTSNNEMNFKNLVVRGDFSMEKIADSSSKRLSVPFVLENLTTGEKHVFVTDKNGEFSSASSWNKHTYNTNGNDALMDAEEIKTSDMDPTAGIYFGLGENGSMAEANNDYAALPYGKYKMTELRCENNAGYALQKFEFYIYKNNRVVDLGTITDDVIVPEIATTAIDKATNSHIVALGDKVTVVDTVHCEGLTPGKEYKLVGTLMNKDDEGVSLKIDGKVVKATTTFVAKRMIQDVDVTFTFDSKNFSGKTGVVFEKLYLNDKLVAEHTDLTDEKQTVYFPEIKTSASDVESGTQNANPDKEVTIVDKVHYTNLVPGKEYKVSGTLMDKSTNKPLLVDKKEITSEVTFTPEAAEGDVELTFTFDGSALVGKTIVAFESLSYEKVEVAVHEDINDESQSIYFPEIHTTAVDAADGDKSVKVANPVTITDTITYKNLIPGNKYRFVGTLMDKETETALLLDGNPVTSTAEFTAKEASGTIEVDFTIDATTLNNRSLVVFEKLFVVTADENGNEKESEIGKHEDITDEGQTVDVNTIEIHTEAKDKDTNSHTGAVKNVVTIVDTVSYVGLKPGTEYTVKGTLMDKATGKPIQNDGKDVTAQTTFTPTETEGSIDVTFRFNGSDLGGKSVVVFEKLFFGEKEIAHHEDLNDEKQTVVYKAEPTNPTNKTTTNKTTTNVKTGDNTLMTTMFLVFILAISVMGTVLFRKKKLNR